MCSFGIRALFSSHPPTCCPFAMSLLNDDGMLWNDCRVYCCCFDDVWIVILIVNGLPNDLVFVYDSECS